MPTVLLWQGYRFYFFSNEGFEPPHIHVDKSGNSAKFWLDPVAVARNFGFSQYELLVLEPFRNELTHGLIAPPIRHCPACPGNQWIARMKRAMTNRGMVQPNPNKL